jgi:lysophospholipase L1-like esterase
MGRLNLFLKGNLDLRDSLQALRSTSGVQWNGINEVFRARLPGTVARIRHETYTRSDALLNADGLTPKALSERSLELGAYTLASQFSAAVFDADADATILSVMSEVTALILQERSEGYRFYVGSTNGWSAEDQAWLHRSFNMLPLLDVDQSMTNLSKIIERRRQNSDAPILIYNLCATLPADRTHCYEGQEGALSTRIKRFNLGLVELSEATGISIVDVDAVLARSGADRLRIDALHLNAEGCRLVAEEVVSILADLGCV